MIDTYVTVPIDVRKTLPTCLSSFSICIFVFSNPCICVCQHLSSSIFIHTNRHIHMHGLGSVLYSTHNLIFSLLIQQI